VKREYGISILDAMPDTKFDAVILAVAHEKFKYLEFNKLSKNPCIVYNIKGFLPTEIVDIDCDK
jgi:UDP-N-acetyl-D-galactosamine dehydrogenase